MNNKIRRLGILIKKKGLVSLCANQIYKLIKKKSGKEKLKKIEDQIEGLYTLLSMSIDITSLQPIDGIHRDIQKADTLLLGIFHEICKKHDLKYWVDYGSLLGAVRHKGFIPWDDDIDVGMLRADYDRLKKIFEEELGQYGFLINEGMGYKEQVFRLIYRDSPIQLDIFPYDEITDRLETESDRERIKNRIQTANKAFYTEFLWEELHYGIIPFPRERVRELLNNIISVEKNSKDLSRYIVSGLETLPYDKVALYDYNTVFPLTEIVFEDIKVFAPIQYEKYLRAIYGDYMKFPNFKICGHANINASRTKYKKEINKTLQSIYNTYLLEI